MARTAGRTPHSVAFEGPGAESINHVWGYVSAERSTAGVVVAAY